MSTKDSHLEIDSKVAHGNKDDDCKVNKDTKLFTPDPFASICEYKLTTSRGKLFLYF